MGIFDGLVESYKAWKQRQADREVKWRAQMQHGFSYVEIWHYKDDTLSISTEPPSFRSWDGTLFNLMMIDSIYALLKGHNVLGVSTGHMENSQFDTVFDWIDFNQLPDTCLIGSGKQKDILLTNHFSKLWVGSLVLETYAMDFQDSVKLFVIGKDVFNQLKNGELTAEACIEQENYDFYIGSGADHCYFTVYRPSHEYDDIIEVIKEVMAPYGLKVEYRSEDEEEKNREEEK